MDYHIQADWNCFSDRSIQYIQGLEIYIFYHKTLFSYKKNKELLIIIINNVNVGAPQLGFGCHVSGPWRWHEP